MAKRERCKDDCAAPQGFGRGAHSGKMQRIGVSF
jgi:hypothetical protein